VFVEKIKIEPGSGGASSHCAVLYYIITSLVEGTNKAQPISAPIL
jgi:hypothetical protein